MALQPYFNGSHVGLCEQCVVKREEYYRYPTEIANGLLASPDIERQAFFALMLRHLALGFFNFDTDFEDIIPALALLCANHTIIPKGHTPKDIAYYSKINLDLIGEKIDVGLVLQNMLSDENPVARLSGLVAIRRWGGSPGIDALIKLLSDDDAAVREEALSTLERETGKSFWFRKGDPRKWKRFWANKEKISE